MVQYNKITLADSIKEIGEKAFMGCINLTSVEISYGVKKIMDGAFALCDSLESVTIPDSVTEMGKSAFKGCKALSSVVLSGCLKNIGDETFKDCYKLSSISIPNRVQTISREAFSHCYALKSISIPNNVTSIGEAAFKSCGFLESASIACEQIGKQAFASCGKLSSVSFSDNVKTIGERAFSQCYGLENQDFEISSGVETIEGNPFWGYKVNLTVAPDNRYYRMMDGNLYTANGKELVAHFSSDEEAPFTVPNRVVRIGAYAFSSVGAKSVIMPNTVKEFGCGAFMDKSDAASMRIDMVLAVDDIYFKGKKAEWESILVHYMQDRKETERRTLTIGDIIKNTTRYSKPTVLPRVHFKTLFGYTK